MAYGKGYSLATSLKHWAKDSLWTLSMSERASDTKPPDSRQQVLHAEAGGFMYEEHIDAFILGKLPGLSRGLVLGGFAYRGLM